MAYEPYFCGPTKTKYIIYDLNVSPAKWGSEHSYLETPFVTLAQSTSKSGRGGLGALIEWADFTISLLPVP